MTDTLKMKVEEKYNIFSYSLQEIPLSQIDVGDRARKDFRNMESFCTDIQQFGLHHPILVLDKEFIGRGGEERRYLLQAGERRLRAVKQLEWETIPAKVTERPLNEWEIKIIELHENIHREGMTPAEIALATEEIHLTYQKIYGKKELGRGGQGHGVEDTARLMGQSKANISRDLEIAKFAKTVPEVANAKTKSEARKVIEALKQKVYREELAKREEARKSGQAPTASPNEKRRSLLMNRYIIGDALQQAKKIKDRTVDLLELDPDWGIDLKAAIKDRGSLSGDDYVEIPPEQYEEQLREMITEVYRVLKDNSWLLCWYSLEDWHDTTRRILEEVGFVVCPMPAFWIHTSNYTATPAYRLAQRTESFFYARKGIPRLGRMGHPNIFTYRTLEKDERIHPAEKPIELYEELLRTFLGDRKAAICVTLYAGSGNFLLAADNLEHNALGFDLTQTYKDSYIIRVNKGTPGAYKSYRQ